ncbi:MAG: endonuclease [Planctomycetota bacterium]
MISRIAAVVVLCGIAAPAVGDPPDGYYDPITGTDGPTIFNQLTTLTNQAAVRSYGDARNILQVTDEDPDNPDNIILTYNGASINSAWTNGATWNREHCWPRSLGVGSSGADDSDLHMLRPCNPSVNSSRGNRKFGTLPGQWDPDQFGLQYRGEMARIVFYAKTRYTYLSIPLVASQSQMIDWHFEQMPDATDAERNDRVQLYQLNRNPYVDRPEWVWAVFGDGPSDAQITVAGSSTIDLGAFIDSGSPMTTTVQFDKTGAAPTTYLVSTIGDVSSPAATGLQAGFARGAQSASIPVTLAAGAGPIAGEVTIESTEITSAGPGLGADDADDTVMITALALEPSLASLDGLAPTQAVAIDLGDIDVGGTTGPIAVPVWNLADPVLGAGLDIDGVSITGLADGVTLMGAPLLGVPAGASAPLVLEVAPSVQGPIAAIATIATSDENLPGESFTDLTITITGTAVNPCPADLTGNGIINAEDLNAWINAYNNGTPACDVNGDGLCMPDDFNFWVNQQPLGCP